VLTVPGGLRACVASESCPGPNLERVALLAPETPLAYVGWRASALEREVARSLDELRVKAEEKGKAPPKALSKKDLARIDELFPKTVVDALLADTKTLQAQGWSQPPGTRWIAYWRSMDALRTSPKPSVLVRHRAKPTTALLALSSDTKKGQVLPPMRDALWRMEAIHEALVRRSDRDGRKVASPVFTGKENGTPLLGHQHATLFPLTLDRRADRIDHVLVYAPMGFDDAARAALTSLSRTYAKDLPTIFVTLAGIGDRDDFAKLVKAVQWGRVFHSVTPFVPPRFLKERGKDTWEEQVQAELERRGLPRAERVELLPEGRTQFRGFRKARRDSDRAPPVVVGMGLRLVFADKVQGPIALGYASHFGLGCFEPEEDVSQ